MKPGRTGPFPYLPINRRPRLSWPNDKQLALWVIPNIEFFPLDEPIGGVTGGSDGKVPDVRHWAGRDYGNRVGVFRLMDVLHKHGIRATVALNSDICDDRPQIIEDAVKLDWELMGHNQTNSRRLNNVPAEEEHAVIRATLERIEKACGKRPLGWLSSGLQETWNSLDYLAQEGVCYIADWVNDDQPYVMKLAERTILSVPYSTEINDKPAFEEHHFTADEFGQMIRKQFDVLYHEGAQSGRVMAIALHPYLTGQAHRIGALDSALKHICAHEGVWRATGSEIARHYLSQATGNI
jgi:allantoinase